MCLFSRKGVIASDTKQSKTYCKQIMQISLDKASSVDTEWEVRKPGCTEQMPFYVLTFKEALHRASFG